MKEKILKVLRRGEWVSGAKLGENIGISRTAVWKHITKLRQQGYKISSSPRQGYLLISVPDRLFPEEIKEGLKTHTLGLNIVYYEKINSTQDVAGKLAAAGIEEGMVVVAENQTGGRGRIGRSWASPPGGVYLSIILRPAIKPSEALRFPLIAGVAVAQAIGQLTGLAPQLKWPNDIIIGGRKAGGILTEMSAETDRINYLVIGIGINVNTETFPDEIEEIATSLKAECGKEVSRRELIQKILEHLESLYRILQESGFEPIRKMWKAQSSTIGSWAIIRTEREQIKGEAIDIDEDGALILRKANGALERVIAGDVSIE